MAEEKAKEENKKKVKFYYNEFIESIFDNTSTNQRKTQNINISNNLIG